MSFLTRGLIFATFFGSCLAVGLLLVSLTTDSWVRASPKRTNSEESIGEVYYGLFNGSRILNKGYVPIPHTINMYQFMQDEPDVLNFWLWLVTTLGTGIGLLSSTVAAITSVLKAASASKKPTTMAVLFASNIASVSAQVIAFISWAIHFYKYLAHNLLPKEDTRNNWYSKGRASFGYSFYLLVISSIVVLLNVIILYYAHRNDSRHKHRLEPQEDEKSREGIMLY